MPLSATQAVMQAKSLKRFLPGVPLVSPLLSHWLLYPHQDTGKNNSIFWKSVLQQSHQTAQNLTAK